MKVHNFIRGLSPYPGAVFEYGGIRLKLLRSNIVGDAPKEVPCGVMQFSSDFRRMFIGTSTDAIEITQLQREGKRAMSTEEFLRGAFGYFEGKM